VWHRSDFVGFRTLPPLEMARRQSTPPTRLPRRRNECKAVASARLAAYRTGATPIQSLMAATPHGTYDHRGRPLRGKKQQAGQRAGSAEKERWQPSAHAPQADSTTMISRHSSPKPRACAGTRRATRVRWSPRRCPSTQNADRERHQYWMEPTSAVDYARGRCNNC